MIQGKLRISKLGDPIVTIRRGRQETEQMVYMILADKPVQYMRRRSRIVYIGTTKVGIHRFVHTGAKCAEKILKESGQREINIVPVTCKQEQGIESWKFLEHAMLLNFLEMHGAPPLYNTHGKNYRKRKEDGYFNRDSIRSIIEEFEKNA